MRYKLRQFGGVLVWPELEVFVLSLPAVLVQPTRSVPRVVRDSDHYQGDIQLPVSSLLTLRSKVTIITRLHYFTSTMRYFVNTFGKYYLQQTDQLRKNETLCALVPCTGWPRYETFSIFSMDKLLQRRLSTKKGLSKVRWADPPQPRLVIGVVF